MKIRIIIATKIITIIKINIIIKNHNLKQKIHTKTTNIGPMIKINIINPEIIHIKINTIKINTIITKTTIGIQTTDIQVMITIRDNAQEIDQLNSQSLK